MFLLVSGGHIGVPEKGHQHGVSIQSFINLGKPFSQYLAFEIFHRPDSWQGFLYIYLFHFPDSSPSVLNGLHFYFSLRDRASRE